MTNANVPPNKNTSNSTSPEWEELEKLGLESDVNASDDQPHDISQDPTQKIERTNGEESPWADPNATQALDKENSNEGQQEVQQETQEETQTNAEEGTENKENKEQLEEEKSFTEQELERIADATGRTVDDPEVAKLNLALRYEKYEQLVKLCNANKDNNKNSNTKTMVQRGTLEDLATAKRELEEAMYVANSKFGEIDKQAKRHIVKGAIDPKRRFGEGPADTNNSWVRAVLANKKLYGDKRADETTKMLDGLADLAEDMKKSKIYQTYDLNKGAEQPIKERRQGFEDTGQNGLFARGSGQSVDNIDWKLYPHAPEMGKDQSPKDGSNPEGSGDGDKDGDDNPEFHSVELGDTELRIKAKEKIDEGRREKLEECKKELDALTPDLAEYYARNRRLIVGSENRDTFLKLQEEYGNKLNDYLKADAAIKYEDGKQQIFDSLADRIQELGEGVKQSLIDFCGGDPEHTDKTQEEVDEERNRLLQEALDQLNQEYLDQVGQLREQINAEFIDAYQKQAKELEDTTIDKLDNGTPCRKAVSKILNNKWFKRGLIAAGAVGLAVTGVGLIGGLAAGTVAIGAGFTLGGVAAGAARGGVMGTLMSRQDSKNSAVRGLSNSEAIQEQLKGMDILNEDNDAGNVAQWLMEQYSDDNKADLGSNRKKTAVAAGIGATIGGLLSGINISDVSQGTTTEVVQTGTTPDSYNVDMSQVNVHRGSGLSEVFTDLGGDPSNYQQFEAIAHSLDSNYGMVPGSNGEVAGTGGMVGNFAHTYPGTINTWPTQAQQYITTVAQKAAAAGLIPAEKIGGTAIYNTVEVATTNYIPNAFMNFLTQATAMVGAGIAGKAVGDKQTHTESKPEPQPRPEQPEPAEPKQPASEPESTATPETTERPRFGLSKEDMQIITGRTAHSDRFLTKWWDTLTPVWQDALRKVSKSKAGTMRFSADQEPIEMSDRLKKWIASQES